MSGKPKEELEELGFNEAMEELEKILHSIESEEVDVDRLADGLQRAAQLLEVCRGKIRRAEVEVRQIVQRLEPESGGEEANEQGGEQEEGEE